MLGPARGLLDGSLLGEPLSTVNRPRVCRRPGAASGAAGAAAQLPAAARPGEAPNPRVCPWHAAAKTLRRMSRMNHDCHGADAQMDTQAHNSYLFLTMLPQLLQIDISCFTASLTSCQLRHCHGILSGNCAATGRAATSYECTTKGRQLCMPATQECLQLSPPTAAGLQGLVDRGPKARLWRRQPAQRHRRWG